MKKTFLSLLVCLTFACSSSSNNGNDSDGGNNGASNNGQSDAGNNGTTNPNNGNPNPECEALGEDFKAAVRGLDPRTCFDDEECQIVERAGPCDCAIGVNTSVDTTTFDGLRSTLDQNQCRNPFFCAGEICTDYLNLNSSGDIFARCQGECQIVQVMSCPEYDSKKHGGIAGDVPCETVDDCIIRDDLNPCRCPEAISRNFPALRIQDIGEIIRINTPRCAPVCGGCPGENTLVCADNGMGVNTCQLQ